MTIQEVMLLIREQIKQVIEQEYGVTPSEIIIGFPPDNVDADFTAPCFSLAKLLKKSPHQVAALLADRYPRDLVVDVTALGPYVNFQLNRATLFAVPIEQAKTETSRFGQVQNPSGTKVLIEYSSPNTNKPLHLGHIRNNALGLALTNLLNAAGHEILTATIFNDRGIHICKAMLAYQLFGNGATPASTGIKGDHFVGDYYVAFDKAAKEDPSLLDRAQELLRQWEAGEQEVLTLWRTMRDWVLEGMRETYTRMGCQFELEQFESSTYLLGRNLVQEGLSRGLFYQKPDGSVWVDLTSQGLDEKLLLRRDGTSVYVTQDLGTAIERFTQHKLARAIYVVASEQLYHFQVLFAILKLLGYPWANDCHHFSYGMVYLPEGKMKSREGTVVDADDLLDSMKAMARQVMADSGFSFEAQEWDSISEMIAQGAIKYYILKVNPKKDIHFDPKESLAFEGATGAYLQYTHARIASVFRKALRQTIPEVQPELLSRPEEIALARLIWQYPDIIIKSAEAMNPTKLAQYLLTLAKAFNQFYAQLPIINADSVGLQDSRLALCFAVKTTIANGLQLLGIDSPDKM